MEHRERTLALIKPGGVQRGLIGSIIKRFENKGLQLVTLKLVWPPEQRFRQHYCDLASRPEFPSIVKFMISSPVVPMVWVGPDAVKTVRALIGANLTASVPMTPSIGTVRGDFCMQDCHGTVIHASDSVEAADREINLWFAEKELNFWTSAGNSSSLV